jgi:sugar/nucleoside kinase (ribokinase family)
MQLVGTASHQIGSTLKTLHVPALSNVNVVDTTGAGDTFVGYLVGELVKLSTRLAHQINTVSGGQRDWWMDWDGIKNANRIAVVASGIACEKKGGIPTIPDYNTVLSRL